MTIDLEARSARTAQLVDALHAIVAELEAIHPGRRFPLDGHLVGSIGEAAAEAIFRITLRPGSTAGHDAIAADGRTVEIKGTYGTSGVAVSATSHDHATALIVLRLSRTIGVAHEIVYNGALERIAGLIGPLQKNGQARIGLATLRRINAQVPDDERIRRRGDQPLVTT